MDDDEAPRPLVRRGLLEGRGDLVRDVGRLGEPDARAAVLAQRRGRLTALGSRGAATDTPTARSSSGTLPVRS